ncbi:hypothetical protein [Aeropyrum pernix]|nr:hypothetical protein [Aeropyrum pernix]
MDEVVTTDAGEGFFNEVYGADAYVQAYVVCDEQLIEALERYGVKLDWCIRRGQTIIASGRGDLVRAFSRVLGGVEVLYKEEKEESEESPMMEFVRLLWGEGLLEEFKDIFGDSWELLLYLYYYIMGWLDDEEGPDVFGEKMKYVLEEILRRVFEAEVYGGSGDAVLNKAIEENEKLLEAAKKLLKAGEFLGPRLHLLEAGDEECSSLKKELREYVSKIWEFDLGGEIGRLDEIAGLFEKAAECYEEMRFYEHADKARQAAEALRTVSGLYREGAVLSGRLLADYLYGDLSAVIELIEAVQDKLYWLKARGVKAILAEALENAVRELRGD